MKLFHTLKQVAASTTVVFAVFGTPTFAHGSGPHNDELKVVPPSNQPLDLAGDIITNLIGSDSTKGKYSILDIFVQPQSGPPPHVHTEEDELFYILEGEVALQLNDKAFTATPGTFAFLPKGQPHAFRNLGTKPARMLAFGTPPGFEHIVRLVGLPVTGTPTPPPTDFSFIDPFLEVAAQFQVNFPDTLILPTAATSVDANGALVVSIPVLRPGIDQGPASGVLTVDYGINKYEDVKIPVKFADKERFQIVQIPLLDAANSGTQTLKVTLIDTRDGAVNARLQNQALIHIGGSGDSFEGVSALYNLPTLHPNPQPESLQNGGENISFLATGADTNGSLSIFNVSLDPQSSSQTGIHGQAEEGFYILDGNASFIVNGQTLNAPTGSFVYAPAGNTYSLSNNGTSPVKGVLVSTPAGVENHFRGLSTKRVPEMSSSWGFLALGAWGAMSWLSDKRKQQKLATQPPANALGAIAHIKSGGIEVI